MYIESVNGNQCNQTIKSSQVEVVMANGTSVFFFVYDAGCRVRPRARLSSDKPQVVSDHHQAYKCLACQ
jgi:hypothetical protein